MKSLLVLVVAMCILCLSAMAGEPAHEESFCPAHRAAEQGHNVFEEFHSVMAPAWHNAWPAKDYEALIAVAPKFTESFAKVAAMNPEIKSPTKAERFQERRAALGKIIEEYAAAAEKGDNQAVYDLMPSLHDIFEQTASCLLPTRYVELQGLLMVSETILTNHLPAKNEEGITGSTETLMIQLDALNEETIPDDLQYFKADLLKQFTTLKESAQKVKECCDKKDMAGYEEHLTAFNGLVKEMVAQYL